MPEREMTEAARQKWDRARNLMIADGWPEEAAEEFLECTAVMTLGEGWDDSRWAHAVSRVFELLDQYAPKGEEGDGYDEDRPDGQGLCAGI